MEDIDWLDYERHRADVSAIVQDKLDQARFLELAEPWRADWPSVISRLITFLQGPTLQ